MFGIGQGRQDSILKLLLFDETRAGKESAVPYCRTKRIIRNAPERAKNKLLKEAHDRCATKFELFVYRQRNILNTSKAVSQASCVFDV